MIFFATKIMLGITKKIAETLCSIGFCFLLHYLAVGFFKISWFLLGKILFYFYIIK